MDGGHVELTLELPISLTALYVALLRLIPLTFAYLSIFPSLHNQIEQERLGSLI